MYYIISGRVHAFIEIDIYSIRKKLKFFPRNFRNPFRVSSKCHCWFLADHEFRKTPLSVRNVCNGLFIRQNDNESNPLSIIPVIANTDAIKIAPSTRIITRVNIVVSNKRDSACWTLWCFHSYTHSFHTIYQFSRTRPSPRFPVVFSASLSINRVLTDSRVLHYVANRLRGFPLDRFTSSSFSPAHILWQRHHSPKRLPARILFFYLVHTFRHALPTASFSRRQSLITPCFF